MKNSTRIFLAFVFLLSTGIMNARTREHSVATSDQGNPMNFRSNPVPSLINAVPFYTEDFASGLPSGWTAVDNNSSGVNWRWTTTGIYNVGSTPGLDTLNSVGTSAANGYMIFDSDSSNGTLFGEDADLTSGSIDCSMYNVVRLRFNQLLYHFSESAKVYVSNDGSSWTEVYDASALLSQGQATPNPDVVDVDLTAYAALQSNVYIRFSYIGDYDYWWMIDDVELYEPAAADAGVFAITSPSTSCTILSSTETISVEIYNFGSDSISAFDVSYSVNGGIAVTETVADTIAPGMSFSYSFTVPADFSVAGAYTISAYTSLSGDADNSNDTNNISIFNGAVQVTTSSAYTMGFESNEDFDRWSVEDANFDGNTWVLTNNLANTGTMCARMATPDAATTADDWLFSPCLDLSDTVSYDLEFWYRTLSSATGGNVEVMLGSLPAAFGMIQTIQNSINVVNLNYLKNSSNFSVPFAGVYYIGFHITNADSTTSIRIDDINLEVSTGVGIREVEENSLLAYPNPGNGMLHLQFGKPVNNAELTVTNTMGQRVFVKQFDNLFNEVIDLSNCAEGQYLIRVISDNGVSTQMISILH